MKLSLPGRRSGVGVSLCKDRLEIVQVRDRTNVPDIQVHAILPLEEDVYDNGTILDLPSFAEKIKGVFQEYGLPRKGITLNLPSSLVFMRTLSMPKVNRKQMQGLLQFRIQEDIRFPFTNPVYDFDFYPDSIKLENETEETGEGEVPILLVGAPGDIVNGLHESFRLADVQLEAVELKGLSILRALKSLGKKPEKGTIVLEFSADCMEAHFYHHNVLFMTRSLDITPEQYLETAGTLTMSPVIEEEGGEAGEMTSLNAWTLLDRLEYQECLDSFTSDLGYQIDRWLSFFQYSLNQREITIEQMWLTYDIPNVNRLAQNLSERLDMQVEVVRVPIVSQPGDPPSRIVSLSAAGAALRGLVSDAD